MLWTPYVTELEDRDCSQTSLLWAASDPGVGFRTIALQAIAVVYGTGVSELVDIGNLLVLYITSSSDHITNSIHFRVFFCYETLMSVGYIG